jgi:hypothetical protein
MVVSQSANLDNSRVFSKLKSSLRFVDVSSPNLSASADLSATGKPAKENAALRRPFYPG